MIYTLEQYAQAVWERSVRTTSAGTAPDPDGSYVDSIKRAVWEAANRTTTGGGGYAISGVGGIPSEEAVGSVSLATSISLPSVASEESVGSASVGAVIGLSGVPSEESVGSFSVTYQVEHTITLEGVPSEESIGSASIGVTVGLSGITTAESVGSLSTSVEVSLEGVPSSESVGSASITASVSMEGIASEEYVGSFKLLRVPQDIVDEVFGFTSSLSSGASYQSLIQEPSFTGASSIDTPEYGYTSSITEPSITFSSGLRLGYSPASALRTTMIARSNITWQTTYTSDLQSSYRYLALLTA